MQQKTPVEEGTASFTPLEFEADWWTTIANETDLIATTPATSPGGNPIWRIELGNGPKTLFATLSVHGNEKAPREAGMIWLRNLAYSTDPEVINYLNTHKIVVWPSLNPDGYLTDSYETPVGDVNRDGFGLSLDVTKAVFSSVAQYRPNFGIDVHQAGAFANRPQVETYPNGHESIHSGLHDLTIDAEMNVQSAIRNAGWKSERYADAERGVSALSAIWSLMHFPGLLIEATAYGTIQQHVEYILEVLETIQGWHASHSDECDAVSLQSREYTRGRVGPVRMYQKVFFANDLFAPTIQCDGWNLPEGYTLPSELVEAHGIITEGRFVPSRQEAGLILPWLIDPLSPYGVVAADRVYRKMGGQPTSIYANTLNGGMRKIRAAYHNGRYTALAGSGY